MPRRYRMDSRAVAVAETRQRIVQASKDLQAQQGVLGTSWEQIGRRAGVSQATVYRHFPSLEALIPACAQTVFESVGVPTPEQAQRIFGGVRRPSLRLERLIRGTCDCYARDEGWLNSARREQELIPALDRAVRIQQESMRVLVGAALDGTAASQHVRRVILALADYPFWKALNDTGLGEAEATDQIVRLVRDQLIKEGID